MRGSLLLAFVFFCLASVSVFAGNCRLVNTTVEPLSVQVRLSDGSFIGLILGASSAQTVDTGVYDAVGLRYNGTYYASASMPVDVDSPMDRPMSISQQLLNDAIEYAFSYRN